MTIDSQSHSGQQQPPKLYRKNSLESSSDDSYKKHVRKREEKKMFREMAKQNEMIDQIKEKLKVGKL